MRTGAKIDQPFNIHLIPYQVELRIRLLYVRMPIMGIFIFTAQGFQVGFLPTFAHTIEYQVELRIRTCSQTSLFILLL